MIAANTSQACRKITELSNGIRFKPAENQNGYPMRNWERTECHFKYMRKKPHEALERLGDPEIGVS